MINFDFSLKTKIFFGKDKELEISNILKSFGYKKVVIFTGKSSARKSGLLDKVLNILNQNEIKYLLLEGIRANPEISFVRDRLDLVREFAPDCLLAIGGGSVMDTAKSMSVSYYYDGDPFDFNLHVVKPEKALPIGAIVTIAASGSESSTSCVMSNDKTKQKKGFNSELVVPTFAIENPKLYINLSWNQKCYGLVDIMMHTMERYFCESSLNEPCDRFAEGLLISVIQAGKDLLKDPTNYEAHAVLMLMSSLSHDGLMNIGKKAHMPVHQLEHALSGLYPQVPHGAGLAVLFPAWAKYYVKYDVDKFDLFARNVFHSNVENKEENARIGITLLEEFFSSLGMPKTLRELGIESPDIDSLLRIMEKNGTRVVGHHIKPMDQEVAREIFNSCL